MFQRMVNVQALIRLAEHFTDDIPYPFLAPSPNADDMPPNAQAATLDVAAHVPYFLYDYFAASPLTVLY